MTRCLEPDGETVCRFATGEGACPDGRQQVAQSCGLRGADCPIYDSRIKDAAYEPKEETP